MRYAIMFLVAYFLASTPKAPAQFSTGVEYDTASAGISKSRFFAPPVLTPETPVLDQTSALKLFGHASRFDDSSGSLIHIIQKGLLFTGAFSRPDSSLIPSWLRTPAEIKAELGEQHQRALADIDGLSKEPVIPDPLPTPDEAKAMLDAQSAQSQADLKGMSKEPLQPLPDHSPVQLQAEVNATHAQFLADMSGIHMVALKPVSIPSPADIAGQLRAQERELQAVQSGTHLDATPAPAPPSEADIQAKLDAIHRDAQATIAGLPPPDTAIALANPSIQPDTDVQADSTDTFPTGDFQKVLSWDQWYARLAQSIQTPLVNAMDKNGNPAGYAKVRVTIWPNHRLKAELVSTGNPAFDNAVLEAYRSLDGNTVLEYPVGSERPVVTYLTENWHDTPGEATGVHSQPLTGDKEYIHFRW